MDKRHKISVSIAMAALLAAAAGACTWIALRPAEPAVATPLPLVEHCRSAAELLYDVSWAAACLKTADSSNDCYLPDPQAAKVNAILQAEEARCMAAESQAMAGR